MVFHLSPKRSLLECVLGDFLLLSPAHAPESSGAKQNIFCDARREDDRLLEEYPDARAEGIYFDAKFVDGRTIKEDIAGDPQSRDKFRQAIESSQQCALASSRRSDDSNDLPAVNLEMDIVDERL